MFSDRELKLRRHGFEKHLCRLCSQVAGFFAERKQQLSMLGRDFEDGPESKK
jgi:hypothetical protein